ncbi:MAG: hypothetical protein Q8J63_00890 [Candidatus Aquicultor sp.]|nr:hypothetical protein [Candidatus Aquicultor sp.]
MRKINWDEYKAKRAGFARVKAQLGLDRKPSSRVRDMDERNLLIQLDKARLEAWKEEGKFEILGPRKIRFQVNQ